MNDKSVFPRSISFWIMIFVSALVLPLFAIAEICIFFRGSPASTFFHSGRVLSLSAIYIATSLSGITFSLIAWFRRDWLAGALDWVERHIYVAGSVFLLVALFFYAILIFALWFLKPGSYPLGLWGQLALLWWILFAGMFAVRLFIRRLSWPLAWVVAAVAGLVLFQAIGVFQWVTNYPFSQNWSEGSLLYYASLLVSGRLYGKQLPLSMVYPSRAILDSIPFLLGRFPIWVHRLWTALLTLSLPAITGFLVARRLKLREFLLRWLVAGWAIVFLIAGGVKYELQVCVIIILAGMNFRHFWRSLAALTIASFWAGLSRLNWFPVPAVLAILLYFLERPVVSGKGLVRYLVLPVVWFVWGIAVALVGCTFLLSVTHIDWATELKAGVSASIWYRLLPNPLYPPGVLTGVLAFTLPLLLFIIFALRRSAKGMHFIRLLGMGAILAVLFAGGLLVSSKIGGGGDLHNMDAYMVAILIAAGMAAFGAFVPESGSEPGHYLPAWILTLALLSQAGFVFYKTQPYRSPDMHNAEQAVGEIQSVVSSVSGQGEVLFLTQRQLLTFGEIRNVPLVPDYEVVEVATMVNTRNSPAIDAFQKGLQAQRFRLIVSNTQRIHYQVVYSHPFAEENNAWVDAVSKTFLCFYEPTLVLPELDLALYVPREDPPCIH